LYATTTILTNSENSAHHGALRILMLCVERVCQYKSRKRGMKNSSPERDDIKIISRLTFSQTAGRARLWFHRGGEAIGWRSQLKEWTAESRRQSALTALMAKRCGQKLAAGVFSVSESGV
jgi:hypothetical protein